MTRKLRAQEVRMNAVSVPRPGELKEGMRTRPGRAGRLIAVIGPFPVEVQKVRMNVVSVQRPAEAKEVKRTRPVRAGRSIAVIGPLPVEVHVRLPVVRPRIGVYGRREASAPNAQPVSTARRIGRKEEAIGLHVNPRTIPETAVRARVPRTVRRARSVHRIPPVVPHRPPIGRSSHVAPRTIHPQEVPVREGADSPAPNPHSGNPGRTMHRLSSRGTVRHV